MKTEWEERIRHSGLLLGCVVVGVFLMLLFDLRAAEAQGGGPAGSINLASFENTPIRNTVGNIFKFVDGTGGGVTLIVLGIITLVSVVRNRKKLAVIFSTGMLFFLTFRLLIGVFFGAEFNDYEQ